MYLSAIRIVDDKVVVTEFVFSSYHVTFAIVEMFFGRVKQYYVSSAKQRGEEVLFEQFDFWKQHPFTHKAHAVEAGIEFLFE